MKKIISSILAIAMIVSVAMILTVGTNAQTAPWDGASLASAYSGGTGTAEDPYLISTPEELYLIQMNTTFDVDENAYFKLTADINLGGGFWIPIGTATTNPFTGHFDGNGYTVFNFESLYQPAGLFGVISGSVRNLKVDYATCATNQNIAGGIAAKIINGAVIENCEVGENVIVTTGASTTAPMIGGIVGLVETDPEAEPATVRNCISRATVDVSMRSSTSGTAGGIAGKIQGSSVVENVINYGTVKFTYQDVPEKDQTSFGGIAGSPAGADGPGFIKNAINFGKVEGNDSYAGGIIGATTNVDGGSLTNCFNVSTDISGTKGCGSVLGRGPKDFVASGCVAIITDTLTEFVGSKVEGLTYGGDGIARASSSADFELNAAYNEIMSTVPAALPTWNTVEDIDYDPEIHGKPEDSTPEDTDPITPEDTDPITPTETDPQTPVETKPQTPAQTQKPSAGTEKPADDGGCGSVIASGLAIVAVVSLAGVALAKKKD